MFEELVLSVQAAESSRVRALELDALGLREREHLQRWVVEHPEILGAGTQIITTEYDQWQNFEGEPIRDRLDVLGIDPDGRLVVAELKRGSASSTVHMQAVNYAAMVSRLTISDIADLLAATATGARQALNLPSDRNSIIGTLETELGMSEMTLRSPRIVLIAGDFAPTVTASVVWLNEQGVDITLVRFRPYQLADESVIVSFARVFPPPDIEEFTIGRRSLSSDSDGSRGDKGDDEVFLPWDESSLRLLAERANTATLTLLDLCAASPDEPVTVKDIEKISGLSIGQIRGQLAGFTMLLKSPSSGLNPRRWPVRIDWQTGGVANYYFHDSLAALWQDARIAAAADETSRSSEQDDHE